MQMQVATMGLRGGSWSGLVYADHVGGRTKRALAPRARCERCGCWLSRYREEEETRCWACRHLGSTEISAQERERRVGLFNAGVQVSARPDPAHICPLCGG